MKKRSAVFFDLDGTWFRWQLFYEWIKALVRWVLISGAVLFDAKEAKKAYKNRKGHFDTWATQQITAYQSEARLRGMRVSDARRAARQVIEKKGDRVHVFVRELSAAAHELDIHRAIISGSIHELVEVFAQANGIHIFLGTQHPQDADGQYFTGGAPKEWCYDKDAAITLLADKYDLDPSISVAIGDSASDAAMFKRVKYPICFNPSNKLLRLARQYGWAVVWEKKDGVVVFRPDQNGWLHEATLDEILPEELALVLIQRLGDLITSPASIDVR